VRWSELRRPLALPQAASGGKCPRTLGGHAAPKVGVTLGPGPAYPVLGFEASPPSPQGKADLGSDLLDDSWYPHKTLWAVSPVYDGPVLIRGGRIDHAGELRFRVGRNTVGGKEPRPLRELRLAEQSSTAWRYAPSYTLLRGPGCYAFQVDGVRFTEVLVFEAVKLA
jgi:hypothetical protein